MDRAELHARFRAEALERVDAIDEGLLALERGNAPVGTLDAIFREAHSIKGGAGMMGLDEVSRLAHGIEDALDAARQAGSVPQAQVESLLRQCDRLRAAIPVGDAEPRPPDAHGGEPRTATAAEQPPRRGTHEQETRSLRVTAGKVDRLVDSVGEAVLHQRRIEHLVRDSGAVKLDQATEDELDRGAALLGALQDSVIDLRMLALESITGPLPRAVRDIAAANGKEVELAIEGAGTQLDRAVLGAVSDPVTHLLRNAVAHGIETPEERERAGKPRCGRVVLRAEQRGERVLLQVADDGRGVAPDVLRRADGRPLAEVLSESGLSTAEAVTDLSGRGVGFDAVRRSVEEVGGSVQAESAPGKGLTVTLLLPVSLAMVHVLLAERAGAVFALPVDAVERVMAADVAMSLARRPSLDVGGTAVPLADLAAALGGSPAPAPARAPAIVVSSGGRRAAVVAERVLGEQELLVRGLGPLLAAAPGYEACAVLGDGRVAFVLDVGFLIQAGGQVTAHSSATQDRLAPKILVVDDQLTVRELQRSILEAAGYRVVTAGDGIEARDRLASGSDIDLVVTDIEMPRMDGFELLSAIRADAAGSSLPVVVVSSRGSPDDRRRGLEAGADAYIGKDSFDQEALLGTVARLVGR